jgi:hypothetical protein
MMRIAFVRILMLVVLLLVPQLSLAQFGHPLKGSWSGQWGPADSPNRLLLRFDWDGKALAGVINPGANAATIKNVTIDYSNPSAWKVKFQGEGKDATGKPVAIAVDGTLENIGAYYRVFHGTWTQAGQKGDFTLTRN